MMVIAKNPKSLKKDNKIDAKISSIISKGGTVGSEYKEREVKKTELRIPIEIYHSIESVLSEEAIKKSRNTWILEAIYEKLNKK